MSNLAGTYSDLGRHADALAMRERVLEFCRRVLPANHPINKKQGDNEIKNLYR
jgi:hypothetical protein